MASNALTIPSLKAEATARHGYVERLSGSLALADAQKASVQALFDSQFKPAILQIRTKARTDAKSVMDGVLQQIQSKLSPPLTADQQLDLASIQRVHAARAATAGSGRQTGGRWAHHRGSDAKRDPSARLASALGLTDAQATQLQALFAVAKPQFKAIRQDARTQTQALMQQFHAQIVPYLTPLQQQDLASMQRVRERMRAAWQARAAKAS